MIWRQDGLASSYLKMGDADMAKQSYYDAAFYYAKSVQKRSQLNTKDRSNPACDIHLAVSNAKLAIANMALGDNGLANEAEASWNGALSKLKSREEKDAKNAEFAQCVAGLCLQFGEESLKQKRRVVAQDAFDLAEKLLAERDKEGRLDFYGSLVLKQLNEQKQALAAAAANGS